MKSFYISIQSLLIILCLALVSCKKEASVQKERARVITDMAGRQVSLPDTISSVFIDRPSVQMLYAFDTLIAVNRVLNYTQTEKKYLAKSFYEGKPYCIEDNVEQIIKLKPQVLFFTRPLTKTNIDKVNELQRKTNVPVVMLDIDFKKYKEALMLMGKVLHKEAKAKELITFVTEYDDQLLKIGTKRNASGEKRTVYYAEGMKGFKTDPAGSTHSSLLEMIGVTNVAKTDVLDGKGMTGVSPEQIYIWNPEVVLVWSGNFDAKNSYKYIKTSAQWNKLEAVKKNKVYQVPWQPFGWIDRPPGINRLIGLVWLTHLFYPKDFPFEIKSVTKEYFQKFYHYSMTDAEAEEILNPQPKL